MSNTSPVSQSNTRGLRVIIAGGGIGGLSAAIALRRRGHEPVVLERAPKLEAVGAGITLFANAMNALARLGVGEAIRAAGSPALHSAIVTSDGTELTTLHPDLLEGAVAVHTADLQGALRGAAGGVRLGVEVTSVDQTTEGVLVRAADGSEERGDLLVGADGLWSLVRASIAPATPRYAGYAAWRGISPVPIDRGRLSESWGAGERFGLVDIGSRTYWFATANLPEDEAEDHSQRKAELVRRFTGWSPIEAVLEATPDAILRNDVYSSTRYRGGARAGLSCLEMPPMPPRPGPGRAQRWQPRTPSCWPTNSPGAMTWQPVSLGMSQSGAPVPN